ncbi:MAG: AMP nucleosidase Amn [Bacteroidetes bacterium HLUCCA01]|nr:MAG: AMP nucleosidase Amn [Bacteroidetes bacterium HLUCCA01]
MKEMMTLSPVTGEKLEDMEQRIEDLLNYMEEVDQSGYYPQLTVVRSWSEHNPRISGEFAKPRVFSWYLSREIKRLLLKNAAIEVRPSRKKIALNDPVLLDNLDEDVWDFTQKKLFLFRAERIDLSIDRLQHYTGTPAEDFQRYILFTNYDMHVEVFKRKFPDCVQPARAGVQMPAYHHKLDDNLGVTLVNIGVGPSNAKTCTDHVAVLRPDVMIMVGHCGGLRNHQEIGDFVLASGYMRSDGVFDQILPKSVPLTPNYLLNIHLQNALEKFQLKYRLGTVYTTDNRNWEFVKKRTVEEISMSRSIAIDMESATVATNGFRYRVPNATLLCVSDKPLHGKPKLSGAAQNFYNNSKEKHLEVVLSAIDEIKRSNPAGLPNDSLRAADEPLMGGI